MDAAIIGMDILFDDGRRPRPGLPVAFPLLEELVLLLGKGPRLLLGRSLETYVRCGCTPALRVPPVEKPRR